MRIQIQIRGDRCSSDWREFLCLAASRARRRLHGWSAARRDRDDWRGPPAEHPFINRRRPGVTSISAHSVAVPGRPRRARGRTGYAADLDFYAAMSCGPTRAMLMSGMRSPSVAGMGVQGRAAAAPDQQRPARLRGYRASVVASLAELMTDAGYNTYMTGRVASRPRRDEAARARSFKRSFVSLDGTAHPGRLGLRGPQPARYRDGAEIVSVGDDFYDAFYPARHARVHRAGSRGGASRSSRTSRTTPHWPLQAPDKSIARFVSRYDAGYEALCEPFRAAKELGFVARRCGADRQLRASARGGTAVAEEEAARGAAHGNLRRDGRARSATSARSLRHLGAQRRSRQHCSSCSCRTAAPRPAGATCVAPISEHVGKEYDHSVENLGAASSSHDVRRELGERQRVAVPPPQAHGVSRRHQGAGVRALPGIVAPGSRSDATGTVRDLAARRSSLAARARACGARSAAIPCCRCKANRCCPCCAARPPPRTRGRSVRLRAVRPPQRTPRRLEDRLGSARAGAERRWQLFDIEANPRFEQRDVAARRSPERLARRWSASGISSDAQNGVSFNDACGVAFW